MPKSHFNRNCPVHLARRDALYERCGELLHQIVGVPEEMRPPMLQQAYRLLERAAHHSRMVALADESGERNQDFHNFIELVEHNTLSIISMQEQQTHLETNEGFICRFLEADPDRCFLPAMHYHRRADDLLQGVLHLLRMAHQPYWSLRNDNREQLSESGRDRYQRAYQFIQKELESLAAALSPDVPEEPAATFEARSR